MKHLSSFLLLAFVCTMFASCDDEPDPAEREHDSNLIGEWIEYGGKFKYIADYYYFYSDGTCLHGNYEWDIDCVDEDDEYEWYTVDNKYLYIDGVKYKYSCDGTSLEIGKKLIPKDKKHYNYKQKHYNYEQKTIDVFSTAISCSSYAFLQQRQ